MRERLPGITIKPDVSPKEFMERVQDLVTRQEIWEISRFEKGRVGEEHLLLELAYVGSQPKISHDLVAQFAYHARFDKDRVRVEIRARNWGNEGPSYDSYVGAAHLIKPLLSLYNIEYKTRVRLNIESRKDLEPRLSPKAKEFFDNFASMANKSVPHPLDLGRFYDFVIVSHMVRSKLTSEDIVYLLVQKGFNERYAQDIANIYDHGREILKRPRDPILAKEHQVLLQQRRSASSPYLP
jgi:hypothetical protein